MRTMIAWLATVAIASAAQTVVSTTETITEVKEYVGSVYSHKETMIATRMMGYIKKINVEEGDLVSKGDVLFEVDPSDIESAQRQAEAGVLSAKSLYVDAKRDYDRFEELSKKGVVPQRDFEKMKLNLDLREQQLKMAEAGLGQVKAQMKYTSVQAPIEGIVIHKMSKVAEMANPGRPILILSSVDDLRVKALVKESDIAKIRVGMPVEVYIAALNKSVKTKITSIVPSADPATHSYVVKAELPSVENLLPGMYSKLKIALESRNGVVVPLGAVTQRGGIVGVFTKEGSNARFIPVKVRQKFAQSVEVEGLNTGVTLINYPSKSLQDGQPIQ